MPVKLPHYVQHDGERWHVEPVDYTQTLDGDPAYCLMRGKRTIYARIDECIPDDKPRTRRLKDAGYVLEFSDRGTVTIRESGRRKRYTTSLGAIFHMTVKATVANEKALKRIAKRKGKQS